MTLDPEDPRDTVVAAGRRRLLHHGLDVLRSQLNASVLSGDVPFSRDTTYRVFRDQEGKSVTDAILDAVASAANDPVWADHDAMLHGVKEAYETALARGDDVRTRVLAMLQAGFESQFAEPWIPLGWMLTAASLTASPVWEGEAPSDDDRRIARAIADTRRAAYQDAANDVGAFLLLTMPELGQRPRPGIGVHTLASLVHALIDGAALRRFIDPDALPPELVAEAELLLWSAFTEDSSTADPRRPDGDRNQAMFDRLLEAAAELWRRHSDITVDQVAQHAHVAPEAAHLLFPDVGDLADSLARGQASATGFADLQAFLDPAVARRNLAPFVTDLRRLRDLTDDMPNVVAATRRYPPTTSTPFVDDFVAHGRLLVDALGVAPRSEQLVQDLVDFALTGSAGWPSVVALLSTIGYDGETAPDSGATTFTRGK